MSYSAAFLVHSFLTGISLSMVMTFVMLAPSVLCGIAAGVLIRRKLDANALRMVLEIVLLLMGV